MITGTCNEEIKGNA